MVSINVAQLLAFIVIAMIVCDAHVINPALVYRHRIPYQPYPGGRAARVLQQDPPLAISDASQLAHPAVIANAIQESQLPPELQKSSRFYSDPKTADALAAESWFTSKEAPVLQREADNIPREQVYKIFKNAGFIRRR